MLQTERADTGRTIETAQLANLPIGGSHNFQSLSILVPGAAKPESQHSAFFNPQVSLATRFNGVSRLGNNLQLEGVDDNERTGLLQVLIPPKFGNGHVVLSDRAMFHYKQTTYYDRAGQFTLLWNDPELGLWWPIANPIVSRRDSGLG